MALLDDFMTEDELAAELKAKVGFGGKRVLRKWRTQRTGPPWIKYQHLILYSIPGFKGWLHSLAREPAARSRRAA